VRVGLQHDRRCQTSLAQCSGAAHTHHAVIMANAGRGESEALPAHWPRSETGDANFATIKSGRAAERLRSGRPQSIGQVLQIVRPDILCGNAQGVSTDVHAGNAPWREARRVAIGDRPEPVPTSPRRGPCRWARRTRKGRPASPSRAGNPGRLESRRSRSCSLSARSGTPRDFGRSPMHRWCRRYAPSGTISSLRAKTASFRSRNQGCEIIKSRVQARCLRR